MFSDFAIIGLMLPIKTVILPQNRIIDCTCDNIVGTY